jgi:hypothetical protein
VHNKNDPLKVKLVGALEHLKKTGYLPRLSLRSKVKVRLIVLGD